MPNRLRMIDTDGLKSLTFDCGVLPVDAAVAAAGHTPNGYFWEGMARYLWPGVVGRLELDSEGGMFCAYGEAAALEELRVLIEPYLDDVERTTAAVVSAENSGFAFDD